MAYIPGLSSQNSDSISIFDVPHEGVHNVSKNTYNSVTINVAPQ